MVKDPKEPIGRIERTTPRASRAPRVSELPPPPRAPVVERPAAAAQDAAARTGARATDQFKPTGALERFLHAIARRAEQGVGFYQTIRLPGHGRVIHDRRAGDAAAGEAEAESRSAEREARAPSDPLAGKKRPNYFGDRTTLPGTAQPGPDGTGSNRAEKPITRFESTLVQRFEKGKILEQPLAGGSLHFLKKTATEWMQFFRSFLHRTVKKEAALTTLAEQMVFRGLLKQSAQPQKGMLIGDLAFASGLVEKFARFEVELAHVLPQTQGMEPGASLGTAVIAKGIPSEALHYFAIAAPAAEAEVFAGPREAAGIFTSLKMEQRVAEQLGWRGDDRLRRFGGSGGYAGGAGGSGREASAPEDNLTRFVPWWRWDRESRGGLRRWFVPVALGTLITVLVVTLWLVSRGL